MNIIAYHDRMYTREWKEWEDPKVPEYFNPTTYLLDKYVDTPAARKTALIVDDAQYDYETLLAKVCQAARGLTSLGLESENRILLFGTDSIEFLTTWLGAVRCGVVPAVVSDMYKAPNLLYFLRDTAAKVLFIDEEQLPKLAQIRDDLPNTLKLVVVRGLAGKDYPQGASFPALVDYDDLTGTQPQSSTPLPRHQNDIAYMFYSGGTTGTAKGITHLAHDFLLIPERQGAFWKYNADDVIHATSKKYFTHGLWPGILIPLYWGATCVVSSEPASAEQVTEIVERHHPTKLITVPTVIKNVLLHVEQSNRVPNFSSLSLVVTASEKMPPQVFQKFFDLFGVELLDSIGSSEVTYEWIANRPAEFKRGSLGKPVFGCKVKLVDPDGNEVTEPHQDGEAWVKSRTACLFYWRKFDRTKETFVGPWVRTGDMMRFDEDGFLWFSSRSDDVFKVKGLWVSPIEVEAVITEHPAVQEVAVIPSDDDNGLVKPKAFVVLRSGWQPSEELTKEIRQHVREIGSYKAPEVIQYIESLPRTTVFKIDRRALREQEGSRGTSNDSV